MPMTSAHYQVALNAESVQFTKVIIFFFVPADSACVTPGPDYCAAGTHCSAEDGECRAGRKYTYKHNIFVTGVKKINCIYKSQVEKVLALFLTDHCLIIFFSASMDCTVVNCAGDLSCIDQKCFWMVGSTLLVILSQTVSCLFLFLSRSHL